MKDHNWGVPVVKYTINEEYKVREALLQAIVRVEEESKRAKAYYGALWKTENIQIE